MHSLFFFFLHFHFQGAQLDTPTDDPEEMLKPQGPCPTDCMKVGASLLLLSQITSSLTLCVSAVINRVNHLFFQGQKGEKVSYEAQTKLMHLFFQHLSQACSFFENLSLFQGESFGLGLVCFMPLLYLK